MQNEDIFTSITDHDLRMREDAAGYMREDEDGVASTLTAPPEEPNLTEVMQALLDLAEMVHHIILILQNSRLIDEK